MPIFLFLKIFQYFSIAQTPGDCFSQMKNNPMISFPKTFGLPTENPPNQIIDKVPFGAQVQGALEVIKKTNLTYKFTYL